MRSLLFDTFDTSSPAQPLLPETNKGGTRFSSTKFVETAPTVQPSPGTALYAADADRLVISRAVVGVEHKLQHLALQELKALSARKQEQRLRDSCAVREAKEARRDDERVKTKSLQQKQYAKHKD
jgi:hypothetical protein